MNKPFFTDYFSIGCFLFDKIGIPSAATSSYYHAFCRHVRVVACVFARELTATHNAPTFGWTENAPYACKSSLLWATIASV